MMEKSAQTNILETKLKNIITKYALSHVVKCAILYGSYVFEEITKESDIDVLLVTNGKRLDTLHEFIGNRIIEFTLIGEETLNEMLRETNPYMAGVFLNGKPLYNQTYTEKIKSSIKKDNLSKWIEKYYSEGLKRLDKSVDKGDIINAITLLINAYLLAKGRLDLSYSIDKLAKRTDNTELSKLVKDMLESHENNTVIYAKKIADLVGPTILGKT